MGYYLMIDRFLTELSCNNNIKKSDIEKELLAHLKVNGCRVSRYKEYKTTRASYDLLHSELDALLAFFQDKFAKTMDAIKESRHKQSLKLWYPSSYYDLYYTKSIVAKTVAVRKVAQAS